MIPRLFPRFVLAPGSWSGAKKTVFELEPFLYSTKWSCCQDRLGTNIGKAPKKEVAFSAGQLPSMTCIP
jgi:hypothetical protein